jgi:hypothetical protein
MASRNSTTIPDGNGSPQAAEIAAGVLAAYAAEGLLKEDGNKDTSKVRERILAIVRTHKVITWKDRKANAIKRGDVVRQLFPSTPAPPDGFSETEDPQLAKAVWGQLYKDVWGHLTVGADSALQQLVGATMGNGYALVRASIDSAHPDAVYITDNLLCIERDVLEPEDTAYKRVAERRIALRQMLIMRQPENARRYEKGGNDLLKMLMVTGRDQLAIAVSAATSAATGDDEPGEPGED